MTTNVGWNGVVVPGAPVTATMAPADPAQVQRFNAAMQPQSTEDLSGLPQATDAQLARLPRAQRDQLQARWGDNEAGLRVEAKVRLDLIEKPMQQQIMKDIKKSFRRGDD